MTMACAAGAGLHFYEGLHGLSHSAFTIRAMTRYGILGFGHHARKRLVDAFREARHSRLAGFWRRNEQKAAADAAEYGLAAYPTAEALCASPEIDAIMVTSPDALHLQDVL